MGKEIKYNTSNNTLSVSGKEIVGLFQGVVSRLQKFSKQFMKCHNDKDIEGMHLNSYALMYDCNNFSEYCVLLLRSFLVCEGERNIPTSNIKMVRYFGDCIINNYFESTTLVNDYVDLICNIVDKRNDIVHKVYLSDVERRRLIRNLSTLIITSNVTGLVKFLVKYNSYTLEVESRNYYSKPLNVF